MLAQCRLPWCDVNEMIAAVMRRWTAMAMVCWPLCTGAMNIKCLACVVIQLGLGGCDGNYSSRTMSHRIDTSRACTMCLAADAAVFWAFCLQMCDGGCYRCKLRTGCGCVGPHWPMQEEKRSKIQ